MSQPSPPEITLDLEQAESASARAQRLEFPRTWPSDIIEKVLGFLAGIVNWIWVVLMLIIVTTVTMRRFVGGNTVWAEETQWHLFAVGYMLGIGFAIMYDSHVRVDVVAAQLGARLRAWIELLTIVLIIFPLCWLMIDYGYIAAERAFMRNERSSNVGGLANRWAIRGVIVLAFGVIALAAFARLMRVTAFLFGFPRPRQEAELAGSARVAGAVAGLLGGALALGAAAMLGTGAMSIGTLLATPAADATAQLQPLAAFLLPVLGIAGAALTLRMSLVGAGLMGLAAVGLALVFGITLFSAFGAGLLAIGAYLAFSDPERGAARPA